MILVRCSHCEETLEIDDAFAGGVCRCRHCGTIQTVPADAPQTDPAATGSSAVEKASTAAGKTGTATQVRPEPPTSGKSSKRLYTAGEPEPASASGLDELAEVVASSGVGMSSGLARRAGRGSSRHSLDASAANPPATSPARPADRKTTGLLITVAILFAAVALLSLALLFNDDSADSGNGDPGRPTVETAVGQFVGMELGRKTVFLVDRGTQSQPNFDAVRAAVVRSIEQLPTGSQFQVIFWSNPLDPDSPESGVVYTPARVPRAVTDDTLGRLRQDFDAVNTGGATNLMPALDIALSTKPDALVIVTGNGWTLDEDFSDAVVTKLRGMSENPAGKMPVVHTVAAGNTSDGPGRPLAAIAKVSGGTFAGLTVNTLNDAAR